MRPLSLAAALLALACAPAEPPESADGAAPAAGTERPVGQDTQAAGQPAAPGTGSSLASEGDPWTDAAARGVDFRAIGQEPSWWLELDEEREIRFGRPGEEPVVFSPVPPPSVGIESASVFYALRGGGHRMSLIIEETPCEDAVGGESFEFAVTVELDGETYRGCGKELGQG